MPQGDKSSYSSKQKRQAEHIEKGYESRGVSSGESKRRAWATVNKSTGGGKKSGSGRGKMNDAAPFRKGGKIGGRKKEINIYEHINHSINYFDHFADRRAAGLALQQRLGILSQRWPWPCRSNFSHSPLIG
jgi:hypothetical protein